jgi:uncharacterized membrane protein YciS (DUF1049 family)
VNETNKKDVVVHIFDLFVIVGSVLAGVFYLHTQIDKIDTRIEQRIQAQERRTDDLYFKFIELSGRQK